MQLACEGCEGGVPGSRHSSLEAVSASMNSRFTAEALVTSATSAQRDRPCAWGPAAPGRMVGKARAAGATPARNWRWSKDPPWGHHLLLWAGGVTSSSACGPNPRIDRAPLGWPNATDWTSDVLPRTSHSNLEMQRLPCFRRHAGILHTHPSCWPARVCIFREASARWAAAIDGLQCRRGRLAEDSPSGTVAPHEAGAHAAAAAGRRVRSWSRHRGRALLVALVRRRRGLALVPPCGASPHARGGLLLGGGGEDRLRHRRHPP